MLEPTRLTARRREIILLGLAIAFVLTATVALSLAPFVRAGTWALGLGPWAFFRLPSTVIHPFDFGLLSSFLTWLLCALFATFIVHRRLPNHDPYLLPLVYLLTGWGLTLIWRLEPYFGLRQTAWLIVATASMLAVIW